MKTAKILIVEDESIIAMELEERLTQMGYEVAGVAVDSNTALEKMGAYLPDIVMMDIHLSGSKDGIETAAEIRSRFGIRVIYLTAHADEFTMQRATITEPYGYLLKPFREQEIHATIEMALYQQGMERQLRESENRLLQAQKIARLGIWDWDIASDLTIWSGEMFNIYGITPETFTGKGKDYINFTHPEDRAIQESNIQESFRRAARRDDLALAPDGTRSSAMSDPQQFRIIRPDGSIRWVEGDAVAVVNQAGEPVKMIGILADITQRKQAEEAIRASEENLNKAQHYAHVGSWIWNIKTNQLKWSDEMFAIFGVDKESFSGDLIDVIAQAIHPEDREKVEQSNRNVIEQGVTVPLEYRVVWQDGTIRTVRAEGGELILDEQGKPSLLRGVVQDITERNQAEAFLQASEERYRQLFNSMIDGFALHEIICDENGSAVDYRYLQVNPSFERLTGLRAEKLIGRTVLEVMPNTESYWIDIYGHVALTGRPAFFENYSGELGRYFEVSAYCPRPGQFATIFVDISERKRAEEGIHRHVTELEMLYESGLALSQLLNPKEIGQKILELLEQKLNWHHTRIRLYHPQNDSLELLDFNQPGLEDEAKRRAVVDGLHLLITRSGQGLSGWVVQHKQPVRSGDVSHDPRYIESTPGIHSGLYVPMKLGELIIGVISIESEKRDAFSETDERLIMTLANQAASAFENARLFEKTRQHVIELEMLYQSGLALGQLLKPKEIGLKLLDLLEQKLNWHHTTIRLYHPQDESLELVHFHQPGLETDAEKHAAKEYFSTHIVGVEDGLTGWAVRQSRTIRSGDVINDPHYKETFHGIRSGLYVPIKLGERIIGVISIEDEKLDAFSEADEQLITTLANQAASAFENARLFEETRQRVLELESINHVSLVLRAASKQDEMLAIVLDEALAMLNTTHGCIELHDKTTDSLHKITMRGWMAQLTNLSQNIGEGIAGKVFTSGKSHISSEFASDPETRAAVHSQIPANWGGICLPIRTTQQTLGVLIVSVPSERKLDKNEIRLLETLSEMTGAALQRMQLHAQTLRGLEQLRALRAVDQAIASSFDLHLTLGVLLTHAASQLGVDAADVLLLQPGSSMLELAADHGFHTHQLKSLHLSNSFAGRAIMEHHSIMTLDLETAALHDNAQVEKLWKKEGFTRYWCVPLRIKGAVKGVLEVYRRTALTPDAEWLEFLEALAGQAAITIDNTQLFENLQRANLDLGLAYDATIEGWSHAMDLRDHETEGHTLRVTDLTLKLARAKEINESQLTAIRRGALLHDIGKMGIPDSILLKEGTLTEAEWVIMRKHPQFAYDMLSPISYLKDALEIPFCHHEKWDGTGYPRGLKGEEIPLAARIFAVCDVWDAVTSDRPYRKAWSRKEALKFIHAQTGLHFDPMVVSSFINLVKHEK